MFVGVVENATPDASTLIATAGESYFTACRTHSHTGVHPGYVVG